MRGGRSREVRRPFPVDTWGEAREVAGCTLTPVRDVSHVAPPHNRHSTEKGVLITCVFV
jgi:hypothetical protein